MIISSVLFRSSAQALRQQEIEPRIRIDHTFSRLVAGMANSRDMCRLSIRRNTTNIRLPGESEEILPSCVFEIPRRYLPRYRSVDTDSCLRSTGRLLTLK
ncbi:hypothetical protein PUN28_011802 [Cardiocondyla obscurior]|uniref:Uncharacterized protein n=1 Tax=Cardiocondyla obscurior TaxID=286306 RepID=A0AAW2FFK9_9HYME